MRKALNKVIKLCLILMTLSCYTEAQNSSFKNALGVKGVLVDYNSPITNKYFDGDGVTGAVEYTYSRFLNKSLNLAFPIKLGHAKYPDANDVLKPRQPFYSGDLTLIYKFNNDYMLKESAVIAPYIFAGIGAEYLDSEIDEHLDAQVPLGLGLSFKLAPAVYLNAQSEYRLSLIKSRNSLEHSIGLNLLFGKGAMEKETPPPPVKEETPAPADRDKDGIIDAKDDCPDVAGIAKFAGCPDSDGDGIADGNDKCPSEAGPLSNAGCPLNDADNDGLVDKEDNCPNEKGPKENKGCPYGDADGDGVNDNVDNCPNKKGPASNDGCPEPVKVVDQDKDGIPDSSDKCPTVFGIQKFGGCPDTDGDGIADSDDRCPTVAGTLANKGCPEIRQEEKAVLDLAMRSVQFETGSNTLKTSSYSVLDQVAGIMQKYPSYSLSISGYTDSVGEASSNQRLSERRAKACFDHLVSKGVSASKMSYAGYGESSPIASNDTKEGRARNRRVEFRIFVR